MAMQYVKEMLNRLGQGEIHARCRIAQRCGCVEEMPVGEICTNNVWSADGCPILTFLVYLASLF
jgi:hypothetical protein